MKAASLALSLGLSLGLALAGCAPPDPPKITPISATIISLSPLGMDVALTLDAENPNGIDLVARSVKAKITLDGNKEVGSVDVPSTVKLPAHKTTRMNVAVSSTWSDLGAVAAFATSKRDIPYDVDGTMNLGGDTLHLTVPFHVKGVLTQEQILKAALGSIPRIPGLPVLPGMR